MHTTTGQAGFQCFLVMKVLKTLMIDYNNRYVLVLWSLDSTAGLPWEIISPFEVECTSNLDYRQEVLSAEMWVGGGQQSGQGACRGALVSSFTLCSFKTTHSKLVKGIPLNVRYFQTDTRVNAVNSIAKMFLVKPQPTPFPSPIMTPKI